MISIPPILQGLALGACWKATEPQTKAFMADYRRMSSQFPSETVLLVQTLFYVGEVLAWIAANLLDRENSPEPVAEIMLQTSRVSAHFRSNTRVFPALQNARLKLESALECLLPDNSSLLQEEGLFSDSHNQLPLQSRQAHATGSAVISIIDALLLGNNHVEICIGKARSYMVSTIIAVGDIDTNRERMRQRVLSFLSIGSRFAE
jgi:hypothetical protein